MIGIIAYWEDLDTTPYVKHIWKDTVKPLEGTHLYFVDEDGTAPKEFDLEITYKTFPTLDEALAEHPKAHYVFLEAERNIPESLNYWDLSDFQMPEDNLFFVLGKDSGALDLMNLPIDDPVIVSIDTVSGFAMWAIVVAGIVLYQRKVQWQLP